MLLFELFGSLEGHHGFSGLTAARQHTAACSSATRRASRCRMHAAAHDSAEFDLTLNPRVAAVRASKTMQLSDLATSLREQGADVISLAAGEPDFDTPPTVVQAGIDALKQGLTHYTPNAGNAALLAAICQKLKSENGLDYQPNEIVVSNGAKQSVWQALQAVCSPGDEVIIPAPFWVSYPEMARLAGAEPVIVPSSAAEGFQPSVERLRASITARSRLLILCSPSNPSGAVLPLPLLQAIAEVVREHPRLMVLSDEIYEHIIYPPAQHHSFAALPGMWPRTLTVNGFSKAFAMTGWRLGYLAAPRHFAAAAARIQGHNTSGASSIAQHAGLAALNLGPAGGQPVADMLEAFHKRRDFVVAALLDIGGVQIAQPEGAFYALPDCSAFCGPQHHADDFGPVPDDDALCRFLLEKALVAVVPGSAFGAEQCIRISYAAALPVLERALSRIAAALQQIRSA